MHLKIVFSACLLAFSSFAWAAGPEDLKIHLPVVKFKLKNGLTVLLHQDRSVPMVSYHTWYRVGSRDEQPGVTGAAHMLEHMMFKGAKKYTGKDFDRILHENGISNNAFTSYDYTGFYENLPSGKLELIMDMEVDRMRHLAILPEDLKSELEVVKEERRWRIDNNPPQLLREGLMATMFKEHPYRWPVIGYMSDITAYTSEKLRKFYDEFYVPNNAVLVLAGDFEIDSTRAMIERYYGTLPHKEMARRTYPVESDAKEPRRFVTDSDVQNSTIMLAFKGVEAGHADSFALDLAASVLADGQSSRLYKRLVYKDQTATSTGGHNLTNANPGLFMLVASLKPGQKTDGPEKILREEAVRLQKDLVSEKELQKAKNAVMKGYIEELTTIDGKARALAVNEILYGSYEKLFTDLDLYQKVTPQDVQKAAQKYLRVDREVVGILNPKPRAVTDASAGSKERK